MSDINKNQHTQIFENFRLFKTTVVSKYLMTLNSSLAQSAGKLRPLAEYAQGYL